LVSGAPRRGPANSLTDVPGLHVGHATLTGEGWLTGVTVVVAGPDGAVGGVDVRGGGPGTRETDLLDPRNAVERVNAIVLGGGSAYGLAAAHGVMTRLAALHRGVKMGPEPSHVVPIVPAAILFDLGRGGVFGNYPGPQDGAAAVEAALSREQNDSGPSSPASAGTVEASTVEASTVEASTVEASTVEASTVEASTVEAGTVEASTVEAGTVGAGTGAVAGQLKGGVGSASEVLSDGTVTVAALAAVNSIGSVANPRTGLLYGAPFGVPGEFDWLATPSVADLEAHSAWLGARTRADRRSPAGDAGPRPLNTTIGVVATSASLTKAQCAKLAGVAHDGMARAIVPAHSMFDGDTVFALSTGPESTGATPTPQEFHAILAAAANCFTRAVVHAVLSATSVTTPAGTWPSYLDLFPSADTRR
jgi:putative pantetheine hydrolase